MSANDLERHQNCGDHPLVLGKGPDRFRNRLGDLGRRPDQQRIADGLNAAGVPVHRCPRAPDIAGDDIDTEPIETTRLDQRARGVIDTLPRVVMPIAGQPIHATDTNDRSPQQRAYNQPPAKPVPAAPADPAASADRARGKLGQVDLHALAQQQLTYQEVGATAADQLPPGYDHMSVSAQIGSGRDRFELAAKSLMHWGMQRGAGLRVTASTETVAVSSVVVVKMLGVLRAPCRVVYVIEEPDVRGFAYGTLPGHPESGEERFAVRYDPSTDAVYAEVSAFSRPATLLSKLGGPFVTVAQRVIAKRYLRGV